MSQDIPSMKYGDSLYIEGEFKQPEEARNYKGYKRGCYCCCSVKSFTL